MNSPIINPIFANLSLDRAAERPVYLQLADAILSMIRNGKLRSGQKLPGSRELANLLKINRITASKAYEELLTQGWLESAVGRGTFVSGHVAEHDPEKLKAIAASSSKVSGFTFQASNYPKAILETPFYNLHLDDGYPDPRLAPLKEFYRAYRNQLSRSGLYPKFGSYGNPAGPYVRPYLTT